MSFQQEIKNKKETLEGYFNKLNFNADIHTYNVDNINLPSVSGLLKQFYPYVDFDVIASYSAIKQGKTKEEVLAEWKIKNTEGLALGTNTHNFLENYLDAIPTTNSEKAGVEFLRNLPSHIHIVCNELRMYHKKYNYAGTADLILFNSNTNKFIIADYKTNEDLFKTYNQLKAPFSHLNDSSFSKYQLQLSYYKLMFEQVFEVESLLLIHLDRNTGKPVMYNCNDYTEKLKNCFN